MTLQVDPLAMLADRLDPKPDPYLHNVPGWVDDKLSEWLTNDQRMICDAVKDHRYVAVQSCHDVGKSYLAGRLASHWIDTHPRGEAFVVTTAPTDPQVKAILWKEIGRTHGKGGLAGRITLDARWMMPVGMGPEEPVGMGRKPRDYDEAAFQGIHARFVLIIIDEACGVASGLWNAVDSLATNRNARVVAIGNPDDPASKFAAVCKPGSGWKVLRIDALSSPNFTADRVRQYPELMAYMIKEGVAPSTERVPEDLRDLLIDPEWVAERIKRWGIQSPLFQSKVRGRFPRVTLDTLIQPHWVTLAQARETPPDHTDPRIGVDVARYGSDHSIIGVRLGGWFRVMVDIARGPVTEVAGKVQEVGAGRINTPIANVDDTGVGGGVTDILEEDGYPTVPLVSGAACSPEEVLPNGKPRFVDARSEWWWRAMEALAGPSGTGEDSTIDLDHEDDELAAQLTNVKYTINRHGQIKVESKDDMRSRGLSSPDRGDTFVYSLVRKLPESVPQSERMLTSSLLQPDVW